MAQFFDALAVAVRLDGADWPTAADALIAVVTNRLHSDVSRRGYRTALRQFLAWHLSQGGGGPLSRALVQRYRVTLEQRDLAPSTINQHLSAIRALADECAESGLLDQPIAAAVGRVKGVPVRGVRAGNWLTRDQAEKLLLAPPNTLMGLRDRAILGLLIGCGLRRDELVNLTFEHLQQREGRWVIVDIVGKGRRVRTVPVPGWAKALADRWALEAGLRSGLVCRRFRKGGLLVYEVGPDGQTAPAGTSADAIADVVTTYSRPLGWDLAPHDLRRTFAKLARSGHAPLEQIQLALGHQNIQTTQRYLGSELDLVDAACDRLGIHVPPAPRPAVVVDTASPALLTTVLTLWLRVENNNKFVRGKTKVRQTIEDVYLRHYAMRKLHGWEYELTMSYEDDADLERRIDDLLRDMWSQADRRNCFIEANLCENGTNRSWS